MTLPSTQTDQHEQTATSIVNLTEGRLLVATMSRETFDELLEKARHEGMMAERERVRRRVTERIDYNGRDEQGLGWITEVEMKEILK